MIQGVGNNNVSAESFRTTSNYQRKGKEGIGDENVKKPIKEDGAVFSKEKGEAVSENETVRGGKNNSDEIVRTIKDEYRRLQASIIRSILKNSGINASGKVKVNGEEIDWDNLDWDKLISESDKTLTPEQIIDTLPDEWKPDAVAERIVNFATSFYAKSGLEGKEFYDKIKAAIDLGFGEADKIVGGKLPGNIKSVITFTRNAVYEKLDNWAKNMGIEIPYTGEDKSKVDVKA
ncbi:MAG: DUF5610 domain-containing protein [Chitinispirillales bacterium]|jgi:hypothetical protein|nr:DUF5610 domain-containing protein [Chitinispirillales bacterium]